MGVILEITWFDAWSETSELSEEGIDGMVSVTRKNVGYLMKEDEHDIVLSYGVTEWSKIGKDEDVFTDNLVIPKTLIVGMIRLGEKC